MGPEEGRSGSFSVTHCATRVVDFRVNFPVDFRVDFPGLVGGRGQSVDRRRHLLQLQQTICL